MSAEQKINALIDGQKALFKHKKSLFFKPYRSKDEFMIDLAWIGLDTLVCSWTANKITIVSGCVVAILGATAFAVEGAIMAAKSKSDPSLTHKAKESFAAASATLKFALVLGVMSILLNPLMDLINLTTRTGATIAEKYNHKPVVL